MSQKIIELVVEGRIHAYITPSIVHILGYWLSKAYGTVKAKEILLTLLIDIQVIDISHEITVNALPVSYTHLDVYKRQCRQRY